MSTTYSSPARTRPIAAGSHAVGISGLIGPPLPSSSTTTTASSSSRGYRASRLEVLLLLVGLVVVFVMGVIMSTRLHLLDDHVTVMRAGSGHGGSPPHQELGGGYDAAILEDYMKAREKLKAMVSQMRAGDGTESLSGLVDQIAIVLNSAKQKASPGLEAQKEAVQGPQPPPRSSSKKDDLPPPGAKVNSSPSKPKEVEGWKKKKEVDSKSLPTWKRALQSTAMLIICHNRDDYLDRTLTSILKYHPSCSLLPLVISEDGQHPKVQEVVNKYRDKFSKAHPNVQIIHVHHHQALNAENGYFLLAAHYKWALNQVFRDLKSEHTRLASIDKVIILEEDLDIAPDFFNYFGSLAHFLDDDPQLLTISAWSDNGMNDRVIDPKALYRSDFFPGLGWMMTRKLWDELEPKWPRAYWDDWLREPAHRQGRQVIRPEISRTYHFGVRGTSNAQYSGYLERIKLNEQPVPFDQMDLSFLEADRYKKEFMASVEKAKEISPQSFNEVTRSMSQKGGEVKLWYGSLEEFEQLARQTGVMDNIKARVPRTAYQGVVTFRVGQARVYLVPRTSMYR